ncbi:MAG: 3-hydroxyacyl-CoA dehydrogenase NAD-binding domain-containing protein, partial [Actinomycetota bacterium]|nr:3-hydroxyacyl-CoA dehydrogenase NAD-binding domain-containing protein [Actinomycetota bacterium]
MFVFKAAVVGAGTMGGEIAQVIATAGIPVVLKDVEQRFVDAGLARAREVAKDPASMQLISGTTTYDGFGDVDLVVEAVPERMEVKQAVFAQLDVITPGHAILASNTSSLSISEMAMATTRPEKVVGFHFFYPASRMRLVEVVEGDETSPETMQAAAVFAQDLRKVAIACADVPGFVVNRILNSAAGEVWRVQEERGLSVKAVDDALAEAEVVSMGPFVLCDVLGLDTVLHVSRHLYAAYGDSFYVHQGMAALVEAGELGAKTGKGFYEDGAPRTEGSADVDAQELVERFTLKALVEACLLLEEGVATTREIELGMMTGAGMVPPPFARADAAGLDRALARLERAEAEWGERYAPPAILRRLVGQGRHGAATGQGFFPAARPDASSQGKAVKLELRGATAIAWLDRPPANSLAPQVIEELSALWKRVEADETIRALVIASANPMLFCAGADIKAFTRMDQTAGRALLDDANRLLRAMERSSTVTVAAVNGGALGGGCELAMGCDVRIAARSATFAQPEIDLGIMPGFGGTQRLPRLVGEAKALEMNLTGEPISAHDAHEHGLVNRV